ncbi:DsrE family protein [Microbulbifer sediminum]|uniref:DsrE family protein n=1 Tax=Microbulbifer sediminum TaxID=2904250 RepID=UPI001F1FFCC0|nr:DsrE family protein [Microbulbifer sediminum]
MKIVPAVILAITISPASATEFQVGPVIENFGPVVDVKADAPLSGQERFRVAFDVAERGENGKPNRNFTSLARFMNLHARAGIKADHIELALVVHGKASFDLLGDSAFKEKYGEANPNRELIKALQENGVRVIICGQSAGHLGIEKAQLLPGVEMALSAMTAHALLQQDGYTLNPS